MNQSQMLSQAERKDAKRTAEKQKARETASPTAGELCGVLLLLTMPTTLNTALDYFRDEGEVDLSAALDETLKRYPDAAAETTYKQLIRTHKPLLDQLLADKDTVEAFRHIASRVQALAVVGGNKWSQPPHPGGADVPKLMKLIKPFDEIPTERG